MGIQKRLAQVGLAKQTAKGTPAAAPTYTVGLVSGKAYDADIEQSELNTSWSTRGLAAMDRISVIPGADFELVAMPNSLGLLLMLALGADVVTGTSPYSHAFTPAETLPWVSLFGLYGADKSEISDAKIDSLELMWEKSGALKVKVKIMGMTFAFDSSWVIGSTGEQVASGAFRGNGGTFDVLGASARVISGSIKIENQTSAIVASHSVTPDDIFEGDVKCAISLTVVPDDFALFRTIITGTSSGTAVQAAPLYGDVTTKWIVDASTDLTFDAPKASFLTHLPDVDPNGGAAEVTIEAVALINGALPPFTLTLRNAVATY